MLLRASGSEFDAPPLFYVVFAAVALSMVAFFFVRRARPDPALASPIDKVMYVVSLGVSALIVYIAWTAENTPVVIPILVTVGVVAIAAFNAWRVFRRSKNEEDASS